MVPAAVCQTVVPPFGAAADLLGCVPGKRCFYIWGEKGQKLHGGVQPLQKFFQINFIALRSRYAEPISASVKWGLISFTLPVIAGSSWVHLFLAYRSLR